MVKTFVYNGENLENNTLMDWEPVKLMEKWCDVVVFTTLKNQFGSPVLSALKTFGIR